MGNAYSGKDEIIDMVNAQIWQFVDPQTYGVVNQAHARFFGKSKGDLEYKKITEALPEKAAVDLSGDNLIVFSNATSAFSVKAIKNYQKKDRYIAITKTPRLDENKKVKYVVCTGIDISDYKSMEGDLFHTNTDQEAILTLAEIRWGTNAEKQLIQCEKLKRAFEMAGAVCHEIMQPLQSVLGQSELLMMDLPNENSLYERLNTIATQIIRLGELIGKLHKITKYEAGDIIEVK